MKLWRVTIIGHLYADEDPQQSLITGELTWQEGDGAKTHFVGGEFAGPTAVRTKLLDDTEQSDRLAFVRDTYGTALEMDSQLDRHGDIDVCLGENWRITRAKR